ncbi:MAG: HlyC/CorC family transporter [Proteobacteria bacterium]|nr:HlyC/CorC family transporter [Pseudomonadota bacterium]
MMGTAISFGGGIVALVASFLLCAFARMMNLGITRSRTARLRELGIVRPKSWRYARLIRIHASRYLLVCQTGFFIGALMLGIALATVAHALLPSEWASLGSTFNLAIAVVAVFGTALIPLLLLQLCRAVAFNFPERILFLGAFPFAVIATVLLPIVRVVDRLLEAVVRVMGLEYPCERTIAVPAEEIREIVEASGEAGVIEEEEKEMIRGVFLLSDTKVSEVMTPRADIVSVQIDSALPEVMQIFTNERLSRLLVIGDGLDDVRGVLHAKDLLRTINRATQEFSLATLIRPACAVAGERNVGDVLEQFRNQAIHFAVVLDEHGGVDGVVTVEDLLEEIVGEIFDEFDSPADEIEVKKTKSGDFLIEGSMSIDDFNERFKAHLAEGEYDTIAGFVLHQLGRLPERGETVDCNRVRLKIEALEGNRITQLRVLKRRRPLRLAEEADSGAAAETGQTSEPKPVRTESNLFEAQRKNRVGSL